MSPNHQEPCRNCGAYRQPCADWEKCRRVVDQLETVETNEELVTTLEEKVEHLETLVRKLVGEKKFNVGLP